MPKHYIDRVELERLQDTLRELLSQLPCAIQHPPGASFSSLTQTFDGRIWGTLDDANLLLMMGLVVGLLQRTQGPLAFPIDDTRVWRSTPAPKTVQPIGVI